MKNTNEIEKQLQHKADAYIKQKAQEMFLIHEEIAHYLGLSFQATLTTSLTITSSATVM